MSLLAPHAAASALLVRYVFEPALRSLALAGAVWLLLRLFRARDVSLRLAAWTAVLYAALAMPIVGGLLPGLPVLVPIEHAVPAASTALSVAPSTLQAGAEVRHSVIPRKARPTAVETSFPEVHAALSAASALRGPAPGTTVAASPVPAPRPRIPWLALAAVLYGLAAAVLLARFAIGFVLSLRLRRSSLPIDDDRLSARLAREARTARLRTVPRLAQSSALAVPVTLGVLRPVILFPETWREWSEAQTSAVLAHELSHVARGDALTQTLSGIHRAIFWFSPLSWLLDRAIVELAEQASDDEALRAGTDRARYAEVLLHFFRALGTARCRIRWQAVSMAQGARSARRVERILSGARLSRRLGQAALAAVALGVVPLFCLAAAVRPALTAQESLAEPPIVSTPPAPPSQSFGIAAAPSSTSQGTSLRVAPPETSAAPPQAHAQAVALRLEALPPTIAWFYSEQAAAPGAGSQAQTEVRSIRVQDCAGKEAFAIDWRSSSGSTVETECTSSADLQRFDRLRRQVHGSFLWFRKNGRSYVVRDPATVKAALQAFQALETAQGQPAPSFPAMLAGQQGFQAYERELESSLQGLNSAGAEQARREYEADLQAALNDFNSSSQQEMARALQQMSQAHANMQAALNALNSTSQQELARAQQQLEAAMQSFNASAAQQEEALRQAQVQMQRELGAMQGRISQQLMAAQAQEEQSRRQVAAAIAQAQRAREAARVAAQVQAEKQIQELRRLIDQAIARGLAKPE